MITCSHCSADNPDLAGFCGSCGRQLAARRDSSLDDVGLGPVVDGDRSSDATRYLCAGVQLDSRLAEAAVRDVLDQQYRAVPTSPGIDLVPVLRHALAARTRQLVRDAALVVLLLFALVQPSVTVWLVTLLLAWAVVLAESLIATYGVVARELRPGSFNPPAPSSSDPGRLQRRLPHIAQAAKGNVTVYGGYVPFVGSGLPMKAWSFALDVTVPADGHAARPFTAQEVHDHVLRGVQRLELAHVQAEDRLFVDGRDVRGDRRFLPQQDLAVPAGRVDPALLRRLLAMPEDRVRPYLCLRVVGWRGQLVLSTFVRFVVTRQHLYVEASHYLLAPIRAEYQEVDRLLPQPTLRQSLRLAGRALRRAPLLLLLSPAPVSRALLAPLSDALQSGRQRREINCGLRFNYGPTQSLREIASDPQYQRYFQELDQDRYSKVIEKALLESLVAFLDEHCIDSGELAARTTTILNNGVYVTGGATVNADSVAAGAGARARSGASAARTRVTQATGGARAS